MAFPDMGGAGEVAELVARSLWISGTAVALASSWSIPLTFLIVRYKALRPLLSFFEGLVGVPTVLVGLFLYDLICPKCPLGSLGLLYTPYAVVLGEALLVTPLIVATSHSALNWAYQNYGELARTFGADEVKALLASAAEVVEELAGSIAMAFSRAVGELGVALIVGGNIEGYTRTLSTAIALYAQMGEYEKATELGLILTFLSVGTSFVVKRLSRGRPSRP
ncbi:ABC transporter permease [Ignicoccus hospitalis]|nr:ABC transporter permease [Ignicoccus hospitalis]